MTLNKDKTYNSKRGCPKCGGESSSDRYNFAVDQIHRVCNNCNFSWYEEPLYKNET
jgi:hypothetical protein